MSDNSSKATVVKYIRMATFSVVAALSTSAQASTYAVAYALEVGDQTETGMVATCEYTKPCEIKSKRFDLSAFTYFIYPANRVVYVSVDGEPGCCLFADGERYFTFEPKDATRSIALYEGHARKLNEFVQNHRLGTLTLRFSKQR
jgi:hypothetical protein